MFRNVPERSGMFHVPGFIDARCSVSDKKYNRNSSGQLTQTCPALAIKTATILELGRVGVVILRVEVEVIRRIKANM